jgi:hypothetical protein
MHLSECILLTGKKPTHTIRMICGGVKAVKGKTTKNLRGKPQN